MEILVGRVMRLVENPVNSGTWFAPLNNALFSEILNPVVFRITIHVLIRAMRLLHVPKLSHVELLLI